MIFCQYQTKFDKLSFLRMHVLADFAAYFDHDYNHSLPPASIEVPRYAAICIAILNRTPYGLPSFPRPCRNRRLPYVLKSEVINAGKKQSWLMRRNNLRIYSNAAINLLSIVDNSGYMVRISRFSLQILCSRVSATASNK